MNEFLKIFGQTTLDTALITMMAIMFLWEKFRKAIDFFTGQVTDKEKAREIYEKVAKISQDIELLMASQVEVYQVRLTEIYEMAKKEYSQLGYVTLATAELYDSLFTRYEALGGNGRHRNRHEEISRLPRE